MASSRGRGVQNNTRPSSFYPADSSKRDVLARSRAEDRRAEVVKVARREGRREDFGERARSSVAQRPECYDRFVRRSLRHAAIALASTALTSIAYVGCGTSSRPPILGGDDYDGGSVSSSDASGTFVLDSGPPVCPRGPDGGVCGCLDLPLLGDAPNLYFVLDRSGSMTTDNKWQTVRVAVADLIRKLGPRGRYGAAVFPDPRTNDCSAGLEVMAPRLGDAPAGTFGPTGQAFGFSTNFEAGGGTPTSSTLVALGTKLAALSGKTFVILATDGGPNCNDKTICDVTTCIPNIESSEGCTPNKAPNCCEGNNEACLDGDAAVNAVTTLKTAGIPTYVIGVPGSGPYASVLQRMALAGGTSRYYDVTTVDQAAFASAVSSIAAQITATCTFSLGQVPPDENMVNVYLDDVPITRDANGWKIEGSVVTLLGATCQKVLSGQALSVRVVAGCPTILK